MPAGGFPRHRGHPIGVAHGVKVVNPVTAGNPITWSDVEAKDSEAVRFRRQMKARFSQESGAAPGGSRARRLD